MNSKEKNENIRKAILVSQMQDHEGFNVFDEYLLDKIKEIRYQDIMGVKDEKTLWTQQGVALAFEDIKQYLIDQNRLALIPMVDPETGEEEVLNKK